MFKTLHNLRFMVASVLLLPVFALSSSGDEKADVQAEADFASGLVDLRFPDYAQKVVEGITAKYGAAAKMDVSRVRIKIMTAKGDFLAAKEEVGKLKADDAETMAMRLALADQLFNWNKLKEARELYDSFFKKYPQGPPPSIERFYGEAAYKYAQMLMRLGDYVNAIQAYRYILLTKLEPKELELRVKTEMCELIVRAIPKVVEPEKTKLMEEAVKLASEVQWSGQESIWFWRTVVVLAHVEMVKGNNAGARKIILAYLPGLDAAEELLRRDKELLKLSPMPECRYLMGTLCEDYARELLGKNSLDDAKKNLREALLHYFTILLKYPSSSWAMDARRRVDDILKLAKVQGWKPVVPKIDNSKFAAEQLTEARLLFQNGDFSNAADKYKEVLGVYFDRPGMVSAVGELARCYIETEITERNPPYFSRAIAGYVADRYCQSTNLYEEAGDTLLLVAGAFENRADRESADRVFDMYFDKYSNHKRAVKAVLHRAAVASRTTNYVDALKYYQLIAVKYTNSPSAIDAIGLTGDCYARLGDHANAIIWYSNYVARLPWNIEQAIAIRRLGDEYMAVDKLVPALNEYNRLVYLLTNRGDKIESTPDNEERKKATIEWGLYQKASCYFKLKTPTDWIPRYQTNALTAYKEFIERFPKSKARAPKALGAMAILYGLQGKQTEANDMFQRLKEDWPDDEYTQNIIFMRVDNYLKLGRTNDAIQAASTMLEKPDAFKPDQFYQIAELMLNEKMYEEASKAFTIARNSSNSNMWQLASLGLGRTCFETGLYEAAAKPLEEILAKNKRSAYTREVNLMLSRCYAEAGKKETDKAKQEAWFGKSYDSMNRVCRLILPAEKQARMEAELELAAIQILQDKKIGAAATYQRVFMFGDAADPGLRPFVGKAFELGTQLLKDLDKYEDVKENCESYLLQFPNGPAKGRAKDWLIWANTRLGTGP